jgi:hypothetical protein
MKIEEMTKRKNWIDDHFPIVGWALANLDSAYAAYVSDVYRELTDVYRELTAATQRAEAAEAATVEWRDRALAGLEYIGQLEGYISYAANCQRQGIDSLSWGDWLAQQQEVQP